MVPYNWDSAPNCNCGPNFISDLIGESPIFSDARSDLQNIWISRSNDFLVRSFERRGLHLHA